MLFSPDAHEELTDTSWSAEHARDALMAIVADAEEAFDDGWSVHPLDDDVPDERLPAKPRALYLGGAGVVAASAVCGEARSGSGSFCNASHPHGRTSSGSRS